jgi:hypothetical protein
VPAHKIRFGTFVAVLAVVALPGAVAAAPYVPPGNSAANQYTEAVPTAGGPKATNKGKQAQNGSPSKVLGSRNAGKLDAQGPEGRAAAEVAAATAPAAVRAASADSAASSPRGSGPAGSHGSTPAKPLEGGSSGASATDREGGQAGSASEAQGENGSSGLGEVIGQATGSSSGQLGLLLPLLIVAVVIWSVAYLLRQQRKRPAG